jgi:hypothetical protein
MRRVLVLVALLYLVQSYEIDVEKEDVQHSVARMWSRQLIAAATRAGVDPTVNARNVFLASVRPFCFASNLKVCMWDSWAAYHSGSSGYVFKEKLAPEGNTEQIGITLRYGTALFSPFSPCKLCYVWIPSEAILALSAT